MITIAREATSFWGKFCQLSGFKTRDPLNEF